MVLRRSANVLVAGLLIMAGAQTAGAQPANNRALAIGVESLQLPSNQAASVTGDVPLEEYMRALAAINPAARDGAQAYLDAYRTRCGKALSTLALRQAVAEGNGDPTLMAMMRASRYRDRHALGQAAAGIRCADGR